MSKRDREYVFRINVLFGHSERKTWLVRENTPNRAKIRLASMILNDTDGEEVIELPMMSYSYAHEYEEDPRIAFGEVVLASYFEGEQDDDEDGEDDDDD